MSESQSQIQQGDPAPASAGNAALFDRLRFVAPDVWDDIEAALQIAIDSSNYGPDLDILDCTLLLDLVRSHRSSPSPVRQGDGWMPIETAPKDGTEVILRKGARVGAARWVKWPATWDVDGCEGTEAGEAWSVGLDGDLWEDPTHWQSLPPVSADSSAPIRQGYEGLLYEHEDGRYAAVRHAADATFAVGEPKWHRVGPVDLSSIVVPTKVRQGDEAVSPVDVKETK